MVIQKGALFRKTSFLWDKSSPDWTQLPSDTYVLGIQKVFKTWNQVWIYREALRILGQSLQGATRCRNGQLKKWWDRVNISGYNFWYIHSRVTNDHSKQSWGVPLATEYKYGCTYTIEKGIYASYMCHRHPTMALLRKIWLLPAGGRDNNVSLYIPRKPLLCIPNMK